MLLCFSFLFAKDEVTFDGPASQMAISYRTERGTVIYHINPQNEDVYLTISAAQVSSDKDSVDSDMSQKSTGDSAVSVDTTGAGSYVQNSEPLTGKVLVALRKAQETFYKADYPKSLEYVNESLRLQKSAEGYALRGTILYMQQHYQGAERSWKEALKYNPDMPGVVDMLGRISTQGAQ